MSFWRALDIEMSFTSSPYRRGAMLALVAGSLQFSINRRWIPEELLRGRVHQRHIVVHDLGELHNLYWHSKGASHHRPSAWFRLGQQLMGAPVGGTAITRFIVSDDQYLIDAFAAFEEMHEGHRGLRQLAADFLNIRDGSSYHKPSYARPCQLAAGLASRKLDELG